jgi:hypothetical protein
MGEGMQRKPDLLFILTLLLGLGVVVTSYGSNLIHLEKSVAIKMHPTPIKI